MKVISNFVHGAFEETPTGLTGSCGVFHCFICSVQTVHLFVSNCLSMDTNTRLAEERSAPAL